MSTEPVNIDNEAQWQRITRIFNRREKPVVSWIGSNSATLSDQQYQRFRTEFARKFEHIEVDVTQLASPSLYRHLSSILASTKLENPLFHLRNVPADEAFLFEVNFERELLFRKLPASVIFWGDDRTEIAFQRFAPDFWDWLVYRFHFEAVLAPGFENSTLTDLPAMPSIGEAWERRMERLQERRQALEAGRDAGGRATLDYAIVVFELGEALFRMAEIDEARQWYEEAIQLFKKEKADLECANTLKSLGDLEMRLGNVERTRTLYDEAIQIYKKEQADLGLANVFQALGDLESRLDDVELARTLYDKAIQLYEKEQVNSGRANTLRALGDLESRLSNVEHARALYDESIQIYEKEQRYLGLANAFRALGGLESRLGNVKISHTLYDKAIQLYKKEQSSLGQANTLQSLGDLLQEAGQYMEALEIYQESLMLYQREQEPVGTAYTAVEILRCIYYSDKQTGKMEDLVNLAIEMAKACGVKNVLNYVMQTLIEIKLIDPKQHGQQYD